MYGETIELREQNTRGHEQISELEGQLSWLYFLYNALATEMMLPKN